MPTNLERIKEAFPLSEPRPGQLNAVKFVLDSFEAGKRFVILEGPTGAGKSVIGYTVGRILEDYYYLTIQKTLQDQITNDFPDIISLKGRNAYPCTFYQRHGQKLVNLSLLSQRHLDKVMEEEPSCAEGYCRKRLNRGKCHKCFTAPKGDLEILPPGFNYSTCPYYEQVGQAQASSYVTMNYSSFLAQTVYARTFAPRKLLILDEGHNVESVLMDFVSISLSDVATQEYGVVIPEYQDALDYAEWMIRINLVNKLEAAAQAMEGQDLEKFEQLLDLSRKIKGFLDSIGETEWVSEYKVAATERSSHTLTLRPVYIKNFNEFLFAYGTHILIMSATILEPNIFCSALGIKKEDVAVLRMKNRIPAENRKIYYTPVAKMSGGKGKTDEWGPYLVRAVNDICSHYPQRGIIHTHNFNIAKYIIAKCSASVRSRLLFQEDFKDKSLMLEAHRNAKDTILIAPALHEGIDLKDDLSRFQIITKIPYPNFFEDKQLARRVELDAQYPSYLACLKLVQSSGRSVRSATDWADTYLIDGSFDTLLSMAGYMLPEWFKESIIKC